MLQRKCTQTAVYWGNPQEDGYGGKTWDDPVEIMCRWEEKTQFLGLIGEDGMGERTISRALVYTLQDVEINGLLYLGTLDDLDSNQEDDPKSIEGICIVKRFEKTQALGSTSEFLRKVFLTPWLT